MSSRVIQSKHIYDAGFHEFYTYGTGALNSNIGISISVQAMTIKNGNVGIGTANPTQKLHIEGNIFAKGNVTCSNISVIGDFVTLNTITSNTEQVVVENAGTGPALKVTQTGNNSVAEFYDKESGLAMIVGNNGNIGIGTNNPMAKLHVNGVFYAQGSIVNVAIKKEVLNVTFNTTTYTATGFYIDYIAKFTTSTILVTAILGIVCSSTQPNLVLQIRQAGIPDNPLGGYNNSHKTIVFGGSISPNFQDSVALTSSFTSGSLSVIRYEVYGYQTNANGMLNGNGRHEMMIYEICT